MTNHNLQLGWFIAVDGGGTKIAVAAHKHCPATQELPSDLEASQVWQHAGTGSAHPTTWPEASRNLLGALQVALDALADSAPIECIYLALAGAGRAEDQHRVIQFVRASLDRERIGSARILCTGDIDPLLELPDPSTGCPTLAVIMGTGSVVATLDAQGAKIRAGGWGPLLGDECSAGAIGLSALQHVTRFIDSGRELAEASPFVRAVVEQLNSDDPDTPLSSLIIETASDRTRRARLSLLVAHWAFELQDDEAGQLLLPHIDGITEQILQVATRVARGAQPVGLLFSGGLVDRVPPLVQAIIQCCGQKSIQVARWSVAQPLLATLRRAIYGVREA